MTGILEFISKFKIERLVDLLLAICIFFIFFLLRETFAYIIIKIFHRELKDKKELKKRSFYKPLSMLFMLLGFYLAVLNFGVSDNAMVYVNKFCRICIIILVFKGIANSLNPNSILFKRLDKKATINNKSNTVVKFMCNIGKIIVYFIAAALIISELGYEINGLITGIGLGTLTVALGFQDLASNVMGGIVIVFDRCFLVGDWIKTRKCRRNS